MSRQKISVSPILTIPFLPVLIVLKLTEAIDISWWWVFGIPILIPLGTIVIIAGMIFLLAILGVIR